MGFQKKECIVGEKKETRDLDLNDLWSRMLPKSSIRLSINQMTRHPYSPSKLRTIPSSLL